MAEVNTGVNALTLRQSLARIDYDSAVPFFSPERGEERGWRPLLSYTYLLSPEDWDSATHKNIQLRQSISNISVRCLPIYVDQPWGTTDVNWFLYEDPQLAQNPLAQQLRQEAVQEYKDFLTLAAVLEVEGAITINSLLPPEELDVVY